MPQKNTINCRIVLNHRPIGAPTTEDFRLEELGVPVPQTGQILLRTLYLLLDPYMRGRMAEGRIKYREDIVNELENAPRAFIGMLEGKNFGKQIVRVAQD